MKPEEAEKAALVGALYDIMAQYIHKYEGAQMENEYLADRLFEQFNITRKMN